MVSPSTGPSGQRLRLQSCASRHLSAALALAAAAFSHPKQLAMGSDALEWEPGEVVARIEGLLVAESFLQNRTTEFLEYHQRPFAFWLGNPFLVSSVHSLHLASLACLMFSRVLRRLSGSPRRLVGRSPLASRRLKVMALDLLCPLTFRSGTSSLGSEANEVRTRSLWVKGGENRTTFGGEHPAIKKLGLIYRGSTLFGCRTLDFNFLVETWWISVLDPLKAILSAEGSTATKTH